MLRAHCLLLHHTVVRTNVITSIRQQKPVGDPSTSCVWFAVVIVCNLALTIHVSPVSLKDSLNVFNWENKNKSLLSVIPNVCFWNGINARISLSLILISKAFVQCPDASGRTRIDPQPIRATNVWHISSSHLGYILKMTHRHCHRALFCSVIALNPPPPQ